MRLQERLADKIVLNGRSISYNGSTSHWNHSLFNSVDSGVFKVVNEAGRSYLIYEVKIIGLFIFSVVISLIASLTKWWFGILGFVILYGLNGIIAAFGHEDFIARLAIGIDELFQPNPPKEENKNTSIEEDPDKEKLKSWF
jgi:hypothetical protein